MPIEQDKVWFRSKGELHSFVKKGEVQCLKYTLPWQAGQGWFNGFSSAWLPWWLREQSVCLQCGRPGFNPQVGTIPWRRKWQATPVLLLGKFHGWRSLVSYSHGITESHTIELLHFISGGGGGVLVGLVQVGHLSSKLLCWVQAQSLCIWCVTTILDWGFLSGASTHSPPTSHVAAAVSHKKL